MAKATIQVKYNNVHEASVELGNLANNVKGKRLDISLTNTKGEFGEALLSLCETLKKYGEVAGDFIEKCSVVTESAGKGFAEMEEIIKSFFTGETGG